jgi:UDP-N-acetylmuramate dehydrogenase
MKLMDITENVSLASHSTMRLGGNARYLAEATSDEDIAELITWAKNQDVPFMMIGDGSNIVWLDEGFPGLIIVNKIRGRKILSEDEESVTLLLKGGENWDEAVGWTVEQDWSGIEFMSLIPGTVGAAPVQNIGAYGGELSNAIIEVEAFDTQLQSFVGIPKDACNFSYRNSRFKGEDKGKFMITGIVLRLNKTFPKPPFYESLTKYFEEKNINEFTPQVVRQAVIAIRSSKLPDPKVVANNGSFFTNPFVTEGEFKKLKAKYPDIKGWLHKDGQVKLAAGWLVEQAGFKGIHNEETGMATWQAQALVLVNEHAKKTEDLLAFKQKIVDKVQEMFGVTLEQEPELLP